MERVRCPEARGNPDFWEDWSSSDPGGFRGLRLWARWTWTVRRLGEGDGLIPASRSRPEERCQT